jgi:pimeloyl-ACP methyl ester carboxylesterase
MVGDGVLRWLIASPKVSRVVAVSRKPLSVQHPKLETVIEADMFRMQHLDVLRDFDACFFYGIETAFAQDLTKDEKSLLIAVQPQTAGAIFAAKPDAAAWRTKPNWYVVASHDNMISPEQEKSMAKEMSATTTVLPSSHVAMLSHPKEVAKVIEDAATGAVAGVSANAKK